MIIDDALHVYCCVFTEWWLQHCNSCIYCNSTAYLRACDLLSVCVRRVNNCCVILLRSINSHLFGLQPNTFIHKQYELYYSTVLQTAVSSKRTSVVIMADGYCNQYHIILTKLSSSTLDIMQSLWWVTEFMTYNWGLKDSMWKLVWCYKDIVAVWEHRHMLAVRGDKL